MSTDRPAAGLSNVRRRRLLTVVAAIVAALVVWLLAHAAGVHVHSPAFGSKSPQDINAGFVVFVSGIASLLGWAALALLERATARARTAWIVLAVVVLLVSLSMPLSGSGVSGGDRLSLVLMHLAVGAVLIPGLARTARRSADVPAPADGAPLDAMPASRRAAYPGT